MAVFHVKNTLQNMVTSHNLTYPIFFKGHVKKYKKAKKAHEIMILELTCIFLVGHSNILCGTKIVLPCSSIHYLCFINITIFIFVKVSMCESIIGLDVPTKNTVRKSPTISKCLTSLCDPLRSMVETAIEELHLFRYNEVMIL